MSLDESTTQEATPAADSVVADAAAAETDTLIAQGVVYLRFDKETRHFHACTQDDIDAGAGFDDRDWEGVDKVDSALGLLAMLPDGQIQISFMLPVIDDLAALQSAMGAVQSAEDRRVDLAQAQAV